jgi:hypothetical protein
MLEEQEEIKLKLKRIIIKTETDRKWFDGVTL